MESSDRPTISPLRLAGYAFASTSSFVLCRSVADAVVLTRLGTDALPLMLILGAVVVGCVSAIWARQTRQYSVSLVVLITQVSASVCTALLLTAIQIWPQSMLVICGLYLLAEIRGCLGTIIIAILLNEGTKRNSDKGRFAFANTGAPLAGIVTGLFITAEATQLHSTNLLAISCLVDIAGWLAVSRWGFWAELWSGPNRVKAQASPTFLTSASEKQNANQPPTRFANALLMLVVCKVTVLGIVSFEWKVYAHEAFPESEEELTAYFGSFYAITDGLTLAIQLLVTRFFLKRKGVVISLLLLPVYLAALGIASLFFDDVVVLFWLLTFARGSLVLRRGLDDVVLQVLYGWLPVRSRRQTVSRILGVAKPIAEAGVAAGILILTAFMSPSRLAWVWLPVLLFWLYSLVRLVRSWKRLEHERH